MKRVLGNKTRVMTKKVIRKYYRDGIEYRIKFPQQGWQPGANTLFYLPLKTNIADATGKVTTSGGGSVSYQGGAGAYIPQMLTIGYSGTPDSFTYMGYFKATSSTSNGLIGAQYYLSGGYRGWDMNFNVAGADGTVLASNSVRIEFLKTSSSNVWKQHYSIGNSTEWHLIALVKSGTTASLYSNGVLLASKSISGYTPYAGNISIGGANRGEGQNDFSVYAGDVFMENKARTAQEITTYYNQTKSNYGL